MKDLFELFPDLPYPTEKPMAERVADVRERAETMRQRMEQAIAQRKRRST